MGPGPLVNCVGSLEADGPKKADKLLELNLIKCRLARTWAEDGKGGRGMLLLIQTQFCVQSNDRRLDAEEVRAPKKSRVLTSGDENDISIPPPATAGSNEDIKLEFPWAWEPMRNSCSPRFNQGGRS